MKTIGTYLIDGDFYAGGSGGEHPGDGGGRSRALINVGIRNSVRACIYTNAVLTAGLFGSTHRSEIVAAA